MPRYIDAHFAQLIADTELDSSGKGIVYWVLVHTPTADVHEVMHGHWILLRESEITGFNPEFAGRDPIGGYQCSNCKEVAILDCNDEYVLSRYCPHCGAKMD